MDIAASLAVRLRELAWNLWWTWQPDVITIFRDLDPALWRQVNHNPVAFVARLPRERLVEDAEDTPLGSRITLAFHRLERYLSDPNTWASTRCGVLETRPVAYFSAEFALHESLPIYSGGLGGLAGDHLKAASDLGVPIVGVGIFYAQGYFQQRIDRTGWQQESYGDVVPDELPLRRATAPDGAPITVDVPVGARRVRVGAWHARVGRARLVLLDTDIDGNDPDLRDLTAQLYGGDSVVRIRQELVLGVGGARMLAALGIRPGVLHLNEGHSAFAPLELARQRAIDDGLPFTLAHREVALRTVFTTHTPVPAGHDWFPPELVRDHLGWLASEARIGVEDLLALGRLNPADPRQPFCMSVLAFRFSRHANGVSALHGHISRQAWQGLWPGRLEAEIPIGHITNGVHLFSWLAPDIARLYDTWFGPQWRDRIMSDPLSGLDVADEAAFWEVQQVLKRRMLNFIRRRCLARAEVPGLAGEQPCSAALDPHLLTVVFARRFAEYKRAALLLTDLDRLARIVNAPGRGVQFVFAGKAHPRDDSGKRVLQRVVQLTRDPRFAGRVVFVEDYDFSVARHLVQGSDVWLNTPRRPLEACGTSGQKVVPNGGLNLSVLDGWWAEAYDGENGFAIGEGGAHSDPAVQDARDAEWLYRVLENDVVPLYYERDEANVPRRWLTRVRRSARSLAGRFNAHRMVCDYVLHCYLPAAGADSIGMGSAIRS